LFRFRTPTLRAAVLLTAPCWLVQCGAKHDLVIGELTLARGGETGSPSVPTAGVGAGAAGGSLQAGSGGTAGSPVLAGQAGELVGGAPAAGAGGDSGCLVGDEPPLGSLIHRYDFSGTGTTVLDLVGNAHGTLREGAELDGSGVLGLPGRVEGQADQYVELPDGLLSVLTDVTLVAWTTWEGGAGFQRVFDFGDSSAGEGQGESGRNYIAVLTTSNFANGNRLGAELAAPDHPTLSLGSYADMVEGTRFQVALVFRSNDHTELFHEALSLISSPVQTSLAELNDVNNWLGRSQWSKDHGFHGSYDEFRVYRTALSACQLATLRDRGPDAP
jgi:hypothetical protein